MNIISGLQKQELQTLRYYKHELFLWYCRHGNLDVIQWLITNFPDIDIHVDDECAFILSCQYNHLDIAKWLINTFPNINIHAQDEYAFIYSCRNGHLHVAQWLIQTFPDINIYVDNDWAFRYSCDMGRQIAQWLTTLCPFYYINHENQPVIIRNGWGIKYLQKQIRKFIRNKHYKKNQYILNEIKLNPHKNVMGYKGYEYKKLEKRMKQELK